MKKHFLTLFCETAHSLCYLISYADNLGGKEKEGILFYPPVLSYSLVSIRIYTLLTNEMHIFKNVVFSSF